MATIRNQRNSDRLVLVQDNAQRGSDAQAVSALGSFYLPSVSGSMFLQPSRTHGAKHGTARHLDHASTKSVEPAWSGCPGRTGLRAASATLSVN